MVVVHFKKMLARQLLELRLVLWFFTYKSWAKQRCKHYDEDIHYA